MRHHHRHDHDDHHAWHLAGRHGPHHRGRGRGHRGGADGGGFRMGKMLADGDLRLIVLALLAQAPRHGYDIIKALEEKSPKQIKLVLLIDEVDELNAYDPRINQRLRSLFMKSFAENLVAVVSGVEIRKQWDKEGSPWYNFFEEVEVTPIGRVMSSSASSRPIGGVFKFDQEVIDRILELTDRKPYHVQRLCVALVNRMYERGRRVITTADVDVVAGNQSE